VTAPIRTTSDSRRSGVVLIALLILVMWVAEAVDVLFGGRLDNLGIEPRDTEGLAGVVLAPFLHGGFEHLASNTVPLAVMGLLIALSGLARLIAVTAIVGLISGFGTWLVAPADTIHIGASGLVFGYATYLLTRGLFSRRVLYLITAVLVAVVWGTALLGGLVPREGISWQAHLFGAVGGVVAARLLSARQNEVRASAARR
jgi:membrane associated rhomboid family serine protease